MPVSVQPKKSLINADLNFQGIYNLICYEVRSLFLGYQIDLISTLKGDFENVQFGKLYVSSEGFYIFRNSSQSLVQEDLPKSLSIYLKYLKENINNPVFKKLLINETLKKGHHLFEFKDSYKEEKCTQIEKRLKSFLIKANEIYQKIIEETGGITGEDYQQFKDLLAKKLCKYFYRAKMGETERFSENDFYRDYRLYVSGVKLNIIPEKSMRVLMHVMRNIDKIALIGEIVINPLEGMNFDKYDNHNHELSSIKIEKSVTLSDVDTLIQDFKSMFGESSMCYGKTFKISEFTLTPRNSLTLSQVNQRYIEEPSVSVNISESGTEDSIKYIKKI